MGEARGISRRAVVGMIVAGPTLIAAARVAPAVAAPTITAGAIVPSPASPADLFDAGDAVVLAQKPTAHLITVEVRGDGVATIAVPRCETGQGITTTVAMLVAEELDLDVSQVEVSLSESRPELLFNQLTGGSTGVRTLYEPVRTAGAVARQRLVVTAAKEWGVSVSSVTTREGKLYGPDGREATYGSVAADAATDTTISLSAHLKDPSTFTVIGEPQSRIDAVDIVTGRKRFAMDVDVPDAKPAMVCRPPTLKAKVLAVRNLSSVKAMPGVIDVVVISAGVAVVAETFGQCIDGVRALQVDWSEGPLDGQSDETVLARLKRAQVPMVPPAPLATAVDGEFVFPFVTNGALEPNCAVADVRPDGVDVWASVKSPIYWQQKLAEQLTLPLNAVRINVLPGGGSFGRKLFAEALFEAVEVSRLAKRPIKLMWHRADDVRHGRMHPMSVSKVRATVLNGSVLTYQHQHTGIETDFGHGFGEMITATVPELPGGDTGLSQAIFAMSASISYNYGVVTQTLNELESEFPTSSMRDVWAPNLKVALETMTDRLAAKLDEDPYDFRLRMLKTERQRDVLKKVAELADWGRSMAPGTAQGIAFHEEFRTCSAVVVEIDCRPETVSRPIRDGVTGPRVTRMVGVVDAGLPVNPRGLEAQMMGGMTDGMSLALTYSTHIKDGLPLEASWDNSFYARQWNMPTDLQVHVMEPTTGKPGGVGELGVATGMAATACAYARATNSAPSKFPINHDLPLAFDVKPRVPPVPASPTDGLNYTY